MWVAVLGRLDLSFGGGCLFGRLALLEWVGHVVLVWPMPFLRTEPPPQERVFVGVVL